MIQTSCHRENMTRKSWMTLLVVLLWISLSSNTPCQKKIQKCLPKEGPAVIIVDNYDGIVNHVQHACKQQQPAGRDKADEGASTSASKCVVLLNKTSTTLRKGCRNMRLQMKQMSDSNLLFLSKWHVNRKLSLYVLSGQRCNKALESVQHAGSNWKNMIYNHTKGDCSLTFLKTKETCNKAMYDENYCNKGLFNSKNNDRYIVNVTNATQNCYNCNNPVKVPEEEIHLDVGLGNGDSVDIDIDPVKAAEAMNKMASITLKMNESSVALSLGEGATGVLVKETQKEELDKMSFGYNTPNSTINIVENQEQLSHFSRTVTVSKQAFEQAFNFTNGTAFAAVVRFLNMAKDEHNSTVLNNEVLAIEMGGVIVNLTDKISITFPNVKAAGTPSCRSWNGEGAQPNWTEDGCWTFMGKDSITCQCTHLTFFAVLMSPLNTTISAADLNSLTYITYVGCGLSLFFLCIVLFMHFLLRRTKASKAMKILVQLVLAMSLLNLTFLTNNWVAKMKSHIGCRIMASVMHYSMLATFTWFAVEAFHLCLQVYMAGKIRIHRYILKVSLSSWALPGVVVTILLIQDKYGERIINTDVTMCWITDDDVHYVVNIGYYALVFLFTFTTFIIILRWLYHLRGTAAGTAQQMTTSKSIFTVMGLCCMLGFTWSFAFFAYGVLQVPSYYIFTTLNSFQGFFLFLYYYNTRRMIGENDEDGNNKESSSSSSNSGTMKTTLDSCKNPYKLKDKR